MRIEQLPTTAAALPIALFATALDAAGYHYHATLLMVALSVWLAEQAGAMAPTQGRC